jgi:hypothetical protein
MSSNKSINDEKIEASSRDDDRVAYIVHKLQNTDKLDKQTANQLSNTITKYYEDQRKLERHSSLKESNLIRSKSLNDMSSAIDLNKKATDKNHVIEVQQINTPKRGYNSVKQTKKANRYGAYLNAPSHGTSRRQWKSEKHYKNQNRSHYNDAKTLSNNNSSNNKFIDENKKPKRPTTIYELYKSNRLHLANLFDSSLES